MTEARGPNPETSSRPCTLSEIQTQNLGRKLSSCFYVNSPECACKGCVETKVLLDHPQLYIVWQHVGLFLFPVEDGALPCRRKRHFLLLHMKSLLLHCQSSCRQNSWSFQAVSLLLMQESLCRFRHTTASYDALKMAETLLADVLPQGCIPSPGVPHPQYEHEGSWHSVLNSGTNNCFSKDYLRWEQRKTDFIVQTIQIVVFEVKDYLHESNLLKKKKKKCFTAALHCLCLSLTFRIT